jgi:ATP-dependent helicase/nuclease subunit B
MPVILHHGPAASLLPFEERVRRSRMEGCLVIVPTRRRIRHLTRGIMGLAPGAVAPALALHTLESLCRALFAASPGARHVVEGAAQTLLYQGAVQAAAGALRYFSPRGENRNLPRGTFERLVDVIVNLRESGLTAADLAGELELSGADEKPMLADVVAVSSAYQSALASLGVEDVEGIYRYLAVECTREQFAATFRALFPQVETVSLAGFDEFSVPEIGVIQKLCSTGGLSVTMMFDYMPGNAALFGHLEENYRLLTSLGFREARGEAEAASAAFFFGAATRPPEARAAADHLARSLFMRTPPAGRADLSSRVTVCAARTRVHEVELICRLIKRLVAERPERDLSALCVAMRTPQLYTDIMREQFARYDIPVNITDRFGLSRSPLIVTLLGVLAVPLRGFRREDVLRVAGSPSIAVPVPSGTFDPVNLAGTSARIRATAGFHAWCGRIDRAIDREGATKAESRDAGEARRADAAIASLRKSKSDLEALERVLRPLAEPLTPGGFERNFLDVLGLLSVPRLLIDASLRTLPELMEKDVRAWTALCDVLADLTAVSEAQGEAGTKFPLHEHAERLRAAVGRERYNIRERFGRGVLVTSIEETRELPVEVMIVAGLVDGEFPSVYQPEVFFSARRRARREQRATWENRYLFYQAATNWTERLYLTYPLRDGELDLVRSSFVDAVGKCALVTAWESPSDIPFAGDIGATEDLLRWYGAASLHSPEAPPEPLPGLAADCAAVIEGAAIEQSRTVAHTRKEYEGSIHAALADEGRQALHALGDRVFSASQLETYAACPFRYFAQHLLRLESTGDLEEELTAAEKGSVIHETLFAFFTSRRDRGLPPLNQLDERAFGEAVEEARSLARVRLDALDIPDVFWEIEKELILGGGGEEGLLCRFLDFERQRREPLRPSFFEVSFGGTPGAGGRSDAELSRQDPVVLGGIRLRGKVDRVECGDGFFTVVDYKTGSATPGLTEIREGRSLQLPLYLHAVAELFRARGTHDLAPAGGFYYRLRDTIELRPGVVADTFRGRAFPAESRHRQLVSDEQELHGVIDGARAAAEQAVAGMTRGEFPLTRPELVDEICRSCGFRTVCRIQTLKHVSPERPEES